MCYKVCLCYRLNRGIKNYLPPELVLKHKQVQYRIISHLGPTPPTSCTSFYPSAPHQEKESYPREGGDVGPW